MTNTDLLIKMAVETLKANAHYLNGLKTIHKVQLTIQFDKLGYPQMGLTNVETKTMLDNDRLSHVCNT